MKVFRPSVFAVVGLVTNRRIAVIRSRKIIEVEKKLGIVRTSQGKKTSRRLVGLRKVRIKSVSKMILTLILDRGCWLQGKEMV